MKIIKLLNKPAFTLAETLITLGIIGVVAAMTIPNLITEHQKRVTVTRLQHAISVMNQSYRLAFDEVGEASPKEIYSMGGEAFVGKYWSPYLKISNICNKHTDCGYKNRKPFRYSNGNKAPQAVSTLKDDVIWFQTIEGFVYAVYYYKQSDTANAGFMYVDITGGSGPNIFGRDVFILARVIDGEKGGSIMPFGYNLSTDQVNKSCTKGGNNSTNCCAEKIRRAGWQIDKSYPW